MENYLRAGLPLKQYAGFATLADPIVQSLEDIDAMAVYDQAGAQLFIVIDKDKPHPKLPEISARSRGRSSTMSRSTSCDTYYQVVLPLRTRFETVGSLVITASTTTVDRRLNGELHAAAHLRSPGCPPCSPSSSWSPRLISPARARRGCRSRYAVTFLIMAGIVVGTLINLYSDGVQSKAKASACTLAQRLSDIVDFNLRLRDFDGLDRVLGGLPATQSGNQRGRRSSSTDTIQIATGSAQGRQEVDLRFPHL